MTSTKSCFQFQQIVLLSHTESSGRVLKIYPRTLIDSVENTKGKSTLIKTLYWAMGCDIKFEEKWSKDFETLVDFAVGDKEYQIYRKGNHFSLFNKSTQQAIDYPPASNKKISSNFIKDLNKILNFNILLPYQNSTKLSSVPPKYYFAVTYIEQDNGWSKLWECFQDLNSFGARNHFELLEYICGVLDEDFYINKVEENALLQEIKAIKKVDQEEKTHLNFFNSFFEKNTSTYLEQLDKDAGEFTRSEKRLADLRKSYLNTISLLSSTESQINLISIAIGELEQDYEYSVSNVDPVEIHCPTCNVVHQNDIVSRFSILKDKKKLVHELKNLRAQEKNLEQEVFNISEEIKEQENKVSNTLSTDTSQYFQQQIISRELPRVFDERANIRNTEIKSITREKNNFIKAKKAIKTKNLQNLEQDFIKSFEEFVDILNIEIQKGKNFNEIIKHHSGGANGVKVMLALRLTVLRAMYKYSEFSVPPFVVDSPRQQDINDGNYELLLNQFAKIPNDVQLIVAAVETLHISKIKDNFHEIFIDKTILQLDEFRKASELIEDHLYWTI